MIYSHPLNALAQLVGFGLGFGLSLGIMALLNLTPIGPDAVRTPAGKPPWCEMAYYVVIIGGIFWTTWRFIYHPYLVPAANWLYLKLARKTVIPWNDCVRLSPLFVSGKDGKWFPVDDLPKIPEDQRLTYLYQLAEASGRLKPAKTTRDMVNDVDLMNRQVDMPPPKPPAPELSDRALGVFAIFGGLVLSYISIISPLMGASRHVKEISTHIEVIIVTPLLLALGIAHTIFGEKAARTFGLRTTRPTALGWIFSIIFVAIGIGLYIWFKNTLKGMGYG